MIKIHSSQDLERLRRLALSSQGLLQAQPYGNGVTGAYNAINHLGYIQIDTISVVERAHHHVLHSRVPKFHPDMTNQMLLDGKIFEYWSHAAAFLPIADYRFSLPYKHAIKSGQTHWFKNPDRKLTNELLARIRLDGPLRSRDVETSTTKRAGWWDWKPAKKALEQLYMQGDLMVSNRESFQKTYDLTERVLPSTVNIQLPAMHEFAAHMMDQQLRCHGFVSLKGITYLRRNAALRKAVKTLLDERLTQRTLEPIQWQSGEVFFIETGGLERPMARLSNRMLILSPFDNSVIQRERLKTLFEFDYQIECYVPAAKRQYGYFCLPLLFRGEFIGRMDCKAHRKNNHFEIKALHFESHLFKKNKVDEALIINAFAKAVKEFCRFQQCDTVSLILTSPKRFLAPLKSALDQTV